MIRLPNIYSIALLAGTAFSTASIAQETEVNIKAQSLGTALNALSEQTGVVIIAATEDVERMTSQPVSGRLSALEAAEQMIGGMPLQANQEDGGAVIIERRPQQGAQPLGTVKRPPVQLAFLEGELEEITVYGELRERSLQDTQTSVSVVDGEELDRSVDKDFFDVVDRLPGVNAQGGGFGVVIRGIPDFGVGGGGQAVNYQIDGASVPAGQALRTSSLSTWDLEQLEILRGAQSTQQGPNALAGAVILRSREPVLGRYEFKARADVGYFSETRFAGAVNIPVTDQIALRISAEDYHSDGDISNQFTGEDNAFEGLTTVRAKARFQPSQALDAVLTYTYSDNQFADQSINDQLFPEERLVPDLSDTSGVTHAVNLRATYDFNQQWSMLSDTSYLNSDYILFIAEEPLNPTATPGGRTVDDISVSQELKFDYSGERLRTVFGGYFQRFEKDLDFEARIPDVSIFLPLPPGLPPISAIFGNTVDGTSRNLAAFGEVEYDLNENWTLVAGMRYDAEKQDEVTTNFSTFTPDLFWL